MPSPFLGMDPYLEDSVHWRDVHHGLISQMQAELNRHLRPKYHVRVAERVYISDDLDPGRKGLIPDLRIGTRPGKEFAAFRPLEPSRTEAGQMAEPIEVTLLDDEIHEAYLAVTDRQSGEVVTVVEILSPTNKVPGSRGRDSYEKKYRAVLDTPTHWLEIDLLREGQRLALQQEVQEHEYQVFLSRAVMPLRRSWIWPIRLFQRLPVIRIPLRGEDPDAQLDLQAVLNAAYDRAGYDAVIDYTRDPTPPLKPDAAIWARERIARTRQ